MSGRDLRKNVDYNNLLTVKKGMFVLRIVDHNDISSKFLGGPGRRVIDGGR